MKIFATLATFALTQKVNQDEKKFSDKPEWMSDEPWESYNDHSPGLQLERIKCRLPQYFDKWFVPTTNNKQQRALARLIIQWEKTYDDITNAFNYCADQVDVDYEPTGYECKWGGWVDKKFEKVTNLFVSWPAMIVREEIMRSDRARRCEKRGERLIRRIDRLNIYTIWHYCDKYDSEESNCKWHYNTALKQEFNPRNLTAHGNMWKFEPGTLERPDEKPEEE